MFGRRGVATSEISGRVLSTYWLADLVLILTAGFLLCVERGGGIFEGHAVRLSAMCRIRSSSGERNGYKFDLPLVNIYDVTRDDVIAHSLLPDIFFSGIGR